MIINEKIKLILDKKFNGSPAFFGFALNVCFRTVGSYVNKSIPNFNILIRMAKLADVNIDDLIFDDRVIQLEQNKIKHSTFKTQKGE